MLWLDAPGPVRAGLVFRVGIADEPFRLLGITHLTEHLALAPLWDVPYWCNGWVSESRTLFAVEGSMDEVTDFLARLTRSLRALPLERLEVERDVLRTEAEGRGANLHNELLHMRFGARGYGLTKYLEFGLRSMSAEEVEGWARERFTAGNAALWMTARPPESLELELEPGERFPAPRPETISRVRIPSQRGARSGDVALAFLGRRSDALRTAASIAERRIEERLRLEAGYSYDVEADYHPLDAEHVHLRLSADCSDAHALPVRDGMREVVAALAEHGPTEAELEHRAAVVGRVHQDPDWSRNVLDHTATDLLGGLPPHQPAEALAAVRALTPGEVAAAVRELLPTELVLVPEEAGGATGPLAKHGNDRPPPVSGREFRPERRRLRRAKWRFVLGEEGLSYVDPDEEPRTLMFGECVALIEDSPGTFSLKAADTTTLEVTPRRLVDGDELERALRERVPRELWVPLDRETAALGELTRALPDIARVGGELTELPLLLAPGERPLAFAEARRRRKLGALLATDRRILWMYAGDDYEEVWLPWEGVRSLRVSGSRLNRRLAFEGGGEKVQLMRVRPSESVEAVARTFTTLSEA